MTDPTTARLRDEYARQTARWNEIKTRLAALPRGDLRVPVELLERLAAVGAGARRVRALPKFGVRV